MIRRSFSRAPTPGFGIRLLLLLALSSVVWLGSFASEGAGGATPALAASTGRILFGHSGDIWVAEDGTTSQITDGGRYWGQPDGLQDGSRIALVGWNANSSDIYTLNADTSDLRQITRGQSARTQSNEWVFYPRWSPDGQTIAYLSDRTTQYAMLWTMRPDGSNQRQVTRAAGNIDSFDTFSWSPDGALIAATAFVGSTSQIYLINPARSDTPRVITKEAGGAFDPTWSPDGRSIAYAARDGRRYAIRMVDAEGDDAPITLLQTDMARSPRWSPTGTALAYLALSGSEFELFVVSVGADSDGHMVVGKPGQLTSRFGIDATSGLSWIP